MHARKKGKSGSKKPVEKTTPTWVNLKPKEVEKLVAKYFKEGKKPSQIGMVMRDEHGIPDVKTMTGKSITKILEDQGQKQELPEDLMALLRRAVKIKEHLEENHKDETSKRGLDLTESKIRRLAKYYKGEGKIPKDWKYDTSKLKLYIE